MKKAVIIVALLLGWAARLDAAAWTLGVTFTNTSGCAGSPATDSTTANFTPAANDLLVVFIVATSTTLATPTVTTSLGGSFTKITSATKAASADTLYLYVGNQLEANSGMTVTADFSAGVSNGCNIFVIRVSGMTKTGTLAVRQSAVQSNQASSGIPTPVFGVACLTTNPVAGFVANATNPATMTKTDVNWTEQADVGYASPTTGAEYQTRDSGFTGTSLAWGGTSLSAFGDIAVEMDASSGSGVTLRNLMMTGVGGLH